MSSRRHGRAARRGAAAAAALVAMGLGAAGSAGASAAEGKAPATVASGLNNPRQLSFSPSGDLYVAESGTGGAGPCVTGPEGEVCFGRTGSVTRVRGTSATRVLRGLPSMAGEGGASATGPSDIEVAANGTYALSMSLGNDPAARAELPAAGHKFGTLVMGRFGASPTSVADIAAFEGVRDFDAAGPDSNPTSVIADGSSFVVADAGANTIFRVRPRGGMTAMATLSTRMVPNPPFMPPGQMPMQSVPTTAVKGPDGAFYVGELTGFPFPAGEARIYRLVPGQSPTVYATGLSAVTSLAFGADGRLYAVQFASAGLLNVPPGELPTGNLVRVIPRSSTHPVIADGLTAPYGVAVRGANAYVTTCAVCAGAGSVVRIGLS